MCDPISIGLTLGGTILQGVAKQQNTSAAKRDINASGQKFDTYLNKADDNYQGERGRQQGYFDKNQTTVADTLANYSRPNVQAVYDDNTAQRQRDYVSPLQAKSFMAPAAPDYAPNSAVDSRNAAYAGDAKARSIGEALAKAKLDAYGDTKTVIGGRAAGNASDIAITDQAASHSRQAADTMDRALSGGNSAQQDVLKYKLEADQHAGDTVGSIGDLFTTAGMLGSMGGGFGNIFGKTGVITGAGKNAAGWLGNGVTPNIGGTGLIY